MRTLAAGLGLLESPRWRDGRLWFADWIAGEIRTVDDQGEGTVVARHASLPLCFDFLPDGSPIVVSGPENALVRLGPDGRLDRHADLSALSPFGGNDIVIDGRAHAYVDNVNYDARSGPAPAGPVAPGFIALVAADAAPRIVADDLAFPNGMAVTPDNRTLIVAESHRSRLTAFDIAPDGGLSGRRIWAGLGDGAPDGICIDAAGAVWYADVPHRRCVRVREGGEVLQTVELDHGAFACMLGGPDGRTLYIVAAHWGGMTAIGATEWDGSVFALSVDVAGAGWPGSG
jgi:sugar lactone lactonase YvrE